MVYLITVVLILFSALFSGLTLGLMSLDVHELKRKIKFGNKNAAKVYTVRKRGNLLLTTLLLGNVGVNAALSIFLGSIASGIVAGIIATALIFLFGEIIPQAIISRHALLFGAKTAWIVRILIIVLFPLCGPIAWILDKLLGHEMQNMFSRNELLSVIEEHEASSRSDLDKDEERILKGALTFSEKTVGEILTPKTVCVMVKADKKVTKPLLTTLAGSGHSRIPVFGTDRDDIIGIMHVKSLVDGSCINKKIKSCMQRGTHTVQNNMPLDDLFNDFITTKQHLFVVEDEFGVVDGIVTLEDVIEEIIGQQIIDEFDKIPDKRKAAKKKRNTKSTSKHQK